MLNINLPLQTPTQLRDETDVEQQRTVKAASWLCSAATYEGYSAENKILNKASAHSLLSAVGLTCLKDRGDTTPSYLILAQLTEEMDLF